MTPPLPSSIRHWTGSLSRLPMMYSPSSIPCLMYFSSISRLVSFGLRQAALPLPPDAAVGPLIDAGRELAFFSHSAPLPPALQCVGPHCRLAPPRTSWISWEPPRLASPRQRARLGARPPRRGRASRTAAVGGRMAGRAPGLRGMPSVGKTRAPVAGRRGMCGAAPASLHGSRPRAGAGCPFMAGGPCAYPPAWIAARAGSDMHPRRRAAGVAGLEARARRLLR